MKRVLILMCTLFCHTLLGAGVSDEEGQRVQRAIKEHVRNNTDAKGLFPYVDQGKVHLLKLYPSSKYPSGFHTKIIREKTLFVGCVDFIAPETADVYDLDILVNKRGSKYYIVQPILHSKNGKRNKYDLSH